MKKALFFSALAVVGLASCSQDETNELNEGRSIEFHTVVDSRASEVLTSNLTQAWVYAYEGVKEFFSCVEFKGNSQGLNSAKKYYWPNQDETLDFYAFYPNPTTLGGTLTVNSMEQKLVGYTSADGVGQDDLIFAKASGKKSTDQANGVALSFSHMLSQIALQAKNSDPTGRTVTIESISLVNANSVGDINFADGTWTNQSTLKSFNQNFNSVTISNAVPQALGSSMMLIPQSIIKWDMDHDKTNTSNGALLLINLNVKQGDVQIYPADGFGTVAVPLSANWERGKKYTYTLDFATGCGVVPPGENGGDSVLDNPIKFTCTVTPMEEGTVIDPVVP